MSGRVYLDHAATSFPKAPGVVDAVARFLAEEAGNPGRGGHRLTVAASRVVEGCRETVAELLGADPERTLLGPGATFWLNTLLYGLLGQGDRVVVSALEHNAVMRPLRDLEQRRGVEVVVVSLRPGGGPPDADAFAQATASAPTRLVVATHASNVSGAILPVEEIARVVAPAPLVVDGAQSAGSLPLDFASLGAAAYVCSGHKGLLGPPGTGVLLLCPGLELEPLVRGGTGSRSESEEMPPFLPDRLEAGTPNTAGLAGLAAAASWIARESVEAIHARQLALGARLVDRLAALPGVRLHGHDADWPHLAIVAFTVAGRDSGELAVWLERERGIMLRVGLHCAPTAHRALGTFPDGALRAGIGPFTTQAEVDALADALAEATGSSSAARAAGSGSYSRRGA